MRPVLGFLVVFAVLLGAGRAEAAIPLTDGWEFQLDRADAGLSAGWHTGDLGSDWEDVTVPHVFDPIADDALYGGAVGWYRLRFKGPEGSPEWVLRFESARREATAWLNGLPIGGSTSGYVPFSVFARGLRPGEENVLVVRVSNIKPATVREGWWNWGGLVRPVTLMPRGRVTVDALGLIPKLTCPRKCTRAQVAFDGFVANNTGAPVAPRLAITLTSPTGQRSTHTREVGTVAPGSRTRVRTTVDVTGRPELWTPKRPRLYDAVVQVGEGGATTFEERKRIGLRQVTVDHGRLMLNNRRVALRGAALHEDVAGRGAALRPEDVERIVGELKALGANVTRAHYLLNDRLLTRLDEEGILVWSQAPNYHNDEELKTAEGRRQALELLRRTVLAARNHPSVITHSVANELDPEPSTEPGTQRFLRAAAKLVRGLDTSVPVSVDLLSYPNIPRQRIYEHYDLLGINSYYGWYKGKPGARSTANLRDLAPYLRTMRHKYPRQAMAVTEFGAEGTFDGPPNEKESYAFQARYVRRTLDILDREKWLAGAIYWTAREFYIRPLWDGGARRAGVRLDSMHNKGLLHYDGRPKPAWAVVRERFARIKLYP